MAPGPTGPAAARNAGRQAPISPHGDDPAAATSPAPTLDSCVAGDGSGSFSDAAFTPTARSRYERGRAAHQLDYADKRARLLSLIESTRTLVDQLREANDGEFALRLPPCASVGGRRTPDHRSSLCEESTGTWSGDHERRDSLDATVSSLELPARPSSVGRRGISGRALHRRPSEPPCSWGASSEGASPPHGMLQVLNLDLRLGNAQLRSSFVNSESVALLFDQRLDGVLDHLDALAQRVADSSSKILVTGDLNAGKSTFVNALLRREILPVDQQPCTTLFCEVLDANQENEGVEEVHVIPIGSHAQYSKNNPRTFAKVDLRHLEKLIDSDHYSYSQLKIYCSDDRPASDSLLHNGIVNIALVDSPGLNTDSLKTTALFARQQEIDVIVFVVNAENHFTLSGKEFLWNAGNEKAHIFIVVNRFDLIRKKDKCRREILDQIRQLSPHTYESADDLVHFVSAEEVLRGPAHGIEPATVESFARLEQCLRNFVLEKRARSKLLPAKRYLSRLLGDLHAVASWNHEACSAELAAVTKEIERDAGAAEKLEKAKNGVIQEAERIIEETSEALELETRARLGKATDALESAAAGAEWFGILSAWTYAMDVRDRLVDHVMAEVHAAEVHVHNVTIGAVRTVRAIGTKALSTAATLSQDVQSVLVPTASASMLESHPDSIESKGNSRSAERPLTLRVELTDFLVDPRERLGLLNVSVSAMALVGTKMLGYQNIVSVLWRVASAVGVPRVHNSRLAWAMIGLAGVGTVSYLLSDVQRTVQRRLSSKLRRQLVETRYVDAQAARLVRRSCRQLRLVGWDLQNRFHAALDRVERTQSSRTERKDATRQAKEWFAKVDSEARVIACRVAEVEVDGDGYELDAR